MSKLVIAGQVFTNHTETFRFTNEEIIKLETTYHVNGIDATRDEYFAKMKPYLSEVTTHENHPNHSPFSGESL
jgi:hypothetical protein